MSRFIKPTPYNNETKNSMWMSMISDGHDIWCSCTSPFTHLLDSIFPEGHTDRDKRICDIIERDLQEWPFGGEEETNLGTGDGDTDLIKREHQEEEDTEKNIDSLLAAAAEDAEKDTR